MPVMDAWEFCRRRGERPEARAIPVVLVSADRNIAQRAKELGAVGFLSKPFDLSDLLRTVRGACACLS